MNLTQKLLSWLGAKINNAVYSQMIGGGQVTWSGQQKKQQVDDGYRSNDIVYSCVNLVSEKAKIAVWSEYEVKDEAMYRKYKAMMKRPDLIEDWDNMAAMQSKALEQVNTPSKISELLKYANDKETFSDWVKAMVSYKLITGDAFGYTPIIEAGANKGMPNGFHALPSQYMSIITDCTKVIKPIVGYQLQINTVTTFLPNEIIHVKDFNPNWDGIGSELYGMSPLEAGARVLTRSNEGKNYAVATMQNGGPVGVMYVKKDQGFAGQDLSAQVDLIKARLKDYRGSRNANKIPVSGLEIGYQPIGLSPVDMAILEAELFDMRAICNLYGVPSQLLNDTAAKTYNSMPEAEKALTVRGAIPALTSLRDDIDLKLSKEWMTGKKRVVDFDISCYPELQKNKKELMDWISKAPISIERTLELLGEPVPDWMDEETRRTILMPSNMTALGEMPIDLPAGQNPYAND